MADHNSIIPQNYAAWRHCITVVCSIALEADYVDARIVALSVPGSEEVRRFRHYTVMSIGKMYCFGFGKHSKN